MLFESACEMYMADKEKRLRANTLEGYRSAIRRHLLPMWGGREIESIGGEELQEWVDGFELAGAAEKAFKTFRQVFRWCVRKKGLRAWDATAAVELPRKRPKRRRALTAEQEKRFLKSIMGEPFERVAIAIVSLGLRPSEGAGLDDADIDYRSGWVDIDRGAHSVKSGTVEYPCKSEHSHRRLKLPRWALARLRSLRKGRGRLRGDLSPRRVYAAIKRALVRAGLGWASVACFRHSWATLALEAGAAIEDIAVSLGHTSTDTCKRHYLMTTGAVVARAQTAYARAMGVS